jgi:hypothetical protein
MTLAALGVLIVLALAAGVLSQEPKSAEPEIQARDEVTDTGPNLPPWWVIVLLFVWPPVVLALLALVWPE